MHALEITSQIGCPNRCGYCPQDVLIAAYGDKEKRLSFDTFRLCVDRLPDAVGVCFAGFAEPFLAPECVEMIEYADKCGKDIWVNTTLVGLKQKHIKRLEKIEFKVFAVHLPLKKMQHINPHKHIRVDDRYLNAVSAVAKSRIRNLQWRIHQTSGAMRVDPKVGSRLAKANQKIKVHNIISRAGNDSFVRKPPYKHGKLVPCQDWDKHVLLPNGDVVLCCMDYGLNHVLGNLLEQSYAQIFEGEEFAQVRQGMVDESVDLICRRCERAKVGA